MQRVSSRAPLLGLALAGGVLAAMLVVFMLILGGDSSTPSAEADFSTPTPTPGVPTPKPNGLGNLSGTFDLAVGPGLYTCIARTDHDSVTNEIKGAAMCYAMFSTELGAPEPPCAAWHGPGPQGASTPSPIIQGEGNCSGHTGPPPYQYFEPTKVFGKYCPAAGCIIPGTGGPALPADHLYVVGCFADIGSVLGPNTISVRQIPNAKAQFAGGPPNSTVGVAKGTSHLFAGATNAACTAAQSGTAPGPLVGAGTAITFTKQAPGNDTDQDGCTDSDELWEHKLGSTTKCGDDPYNPYDYTTGTDVSGNYDIMAVAIRADAATAGYYYSCKADIQQVTKALTARVSCYIDFPGTTVNNDEAGDNGCPPANAKDCGDGRPGDAPPGCNDASCAARAGQGAGCATLPCDTSQYNFGGGDGDKTTVLTGTLNNTTNIIELHGCFKDTPPEGSGGGPLGSVIVKTLIDAHTGVGVVAIAAAQTDDDCLGTDGLYGTTDDGSGIVGGKVPIFIVRQAPGPKADGSRDSDGDGCPDKKELGDNKLQGGLRDPRNRFDFFNPEKTNTPITQRVADILKVVGQFNKDQGNAVYTIDTDRTGIVGADAWKLGSPNGQQRVDDILAAVKQFNHDCS